MKIYSSKSAQNGFGGVLKDVLKGAVQITKNGKPYAVIMTVADYQKLAGLKSEKRKKKGLATKALKGSFLGNDDMLNWLACKLEISSDNVNEIAMYSVNKSTGAKEYDPKTIFQVSNQVKSVMDQMKKSAFVALFTSILELKNNSRNVNTSGIKTYDFNNINLTYDYLGDCMRLLAMKKRS